jgi:histone H3
VQAECLRAFTTDAASQLDVLGHDGHTLGVDGAQVGVLEQTNQVSLSSLLQSTDSRGLETQVRLEVLSNLTNQALEGQLADQKLGRLLESTDLTQSDGTRAKAVRLLDTTLRTKKASENIEMQMKAKQPLSNKRSV